MATNNQNKTVATNASVKAFLATIVNPSPRSQSLATYMRNDYPDYPTLLDRLGKYKMSGNCLHLKKIEDVDLSVLEAMLRQAYALPGSTPGADHELINYQTWLAATISIQGTWFYNPIMDYQDVIMIEPGKRGGKPCIRGMRITVCDVLEYLASGMTEDEILADFPDLEANDIRACLAFAADRERKLVTIPSA